MKKTYYKGNNISKCVHCGKNELTSKMVFMKFYNVLSHSHYYCLGCVQPAIDEYMNLNWTECILCGQDYIAFGDREVCNDCYEKYEHERNRLRSIISKDREDRDLYIPIILPEWIKILDRYDWKCAYCGGEFEEIEHIIPRSKGGLTTRNNIVPSCKRCNRKKRTYTVGHFVNNILPDLL